MDLSGIGTCRLTHCPADLSKTIGHGCPACRGYWRTICDTPAPLLSPTKLPWKKKNKELKRLTASPFHSVPTDNQRQGNSTGLDVDVHEVQLTSLAARFRVAARSITLWTSLERIHQARNCRNVFLFAMSPQGGRLISEDTEDTLRNFVFRKMQAGAVTMLKKYKKKK